MYLQISMRPAREKDALKNNNVEPAFPEGSIAVFKCDQICRQCSFKAPADGAAKSKESSTMANRWTEHFGLISAVL